MSARIASLLVVSCVLASHAMLGQATPPAVSADTTPVIRTTVNEVLVDMIVRDNHHHMITDLHPQEVEIFEDGVPQKIKVFRDVQGIEQLEAEKEAEKADASAGAAGKHRNTLKQVNFVVIVFDQIAPLNVPFAREAVLSFLKSDNLPNTYVTIYRMNQGLTLVQPYTANTAALAKSTELATKGQYNKDQVDTLGSVASSAVASAEAGVAVVDAQVLAGAGGPAAVTQAVQAGNQLAQNPMAAVVLDPLFARSAAAQDASVTLGNALLAQAHFATGMRFLGSEIGGMNSIEALRMLVKSQQNLPGRKMILYLSDGLNVPVNRIDVKDDLISFANRSGVSFYMIDTRGLTLEDPTMQSLSQMQRVGAESTSNTVDPQVGHHEDDDVQLANVSNTQLAMTELADSTGGFAVTNSNEITVPIQRMMEDLRTHYELAYTPTSTNYDGHFRKIEVKVKRPKATVQTRKGYYALPELNGEPIQPYEMVALNAINAKPQPVSFPYHASLIKFQPRQNSVGFLMAFEVPVSGLLVVTDPRTGKTSVQASLVAIIHGANGEVVAKVSRDLSRQVNSKDTAQLATDQIIYAEPVELAPGRYIVDAAVTDDNAGKSTVKRISAFVPSNVNLGVSSLELVKQFVPLAGPRNPSNPFELEKIRILPTLSDSVASGQPVDIYFVVYPAKVVAGGGPEVTVQIFRDGEEIARRKLEMPKPEADGSVPMLLHLSPERGQCDIMITAQQGTLVAKSNTSLKIE
jgi:VWFA-related protein